MPIQKPTPPCGDAGFPGSNPGNCRESPWFRSEPGGIRCNLCPHHCLLMEGMAGRCKTHVARDGKLFTIAYGNPCSAHVDPVEKKPLFHFLPGSSCFSVATAGCNLSCSNCQNWEISQQGPASLPHTDLLPAEVVEAAVSRGCASIAYTYTEPTVFYEYMADTAEIARAGGLGNLMISNGYISQPPLRKLARYLDAANIDLKSFSAETYKKNFGGHLKPVLDTLQTLQEAGVWLEITNLLIPGLTDDPVETGRMCDWLASSGFAGTPLHFSRFHPMFHLLNHKATPIQTLETARNIAIQAGMKYVYIGNVPGPGMADTVCPSCSHTIIRRSGFSVTANELVGGACRYCGTAIAGVW
ncbi:MAG: AmmeMemoRadiSam system radical SAM enzyme [Bacteroidota bacterium]